MKVNGIIRVDEPENALSDRESGGVGTSTHAAKRVGGNSESAKKVRRGAEMRCAASRDESSTAHDPAEAEWRESQLLQRWEYVKKESTGMDAEVKEIIDMSCFAPRPFWLSWADAYYNPQQGEWVPGAEGYARKMAKDEGMAIIMPSGEPNSPYSTWDYLNGKWIEFKTREEKCRYLEKLYGRTDKEIESLIANKELFDGYYPELKKGE